MIGWLLAGLAGAAIVGSNTSSDDEGMISGRDKSCSLCGTSGNDWKVADEWTEWSRSYIKVRFCCRRCGRSWTKTYQRD